MKFLDYIQGYRKGKAANEIEQKSLTDPFLYDAIDGYDAVDGNHLEHIAEMQTRVKNKHLPSKSKRILRILVAAIFFFGIFGGYLFISEDRDYNNLIAYLDIASEKNNIETQVAVAEKNEDLVQLEESASTQELINQPEATTEGALSDYKVDDVQAPIVEIDESELAEVYSTPSVDEMREKRNISVLSGNIVSESQAKEISREANVSGNLRSEEEKPNKSRDQSFEEIVISSSINKNVPNSASISKEKRDVVSEKPNKPKKLDSDAEQANPNGNWFVGAGASSTIYLGPTDQSAGISDRMTVNNRDLSEQVNSNPNGKINEKSIPIIGQKKYNKYLRKNIKYPKDGKCSEIKGAVIVEFNVTKTGRPINIKIVKSLCSDLDQEAIRLVRAGSDWTTSNTSVRLLIQFDGDKNDQ